MQICTLNSANPALRRHPEWRSTQLEGASGAAFDRMFLQMMIEHHTGAIEMAEVELRDGQNADAKALAQKIIEAQRAEITQMRELLTTV